MCIRGACINKAVRRGMCHACLTKVAKYNILFREFLLTIPGQKRRTCIGKPGCKRWSVLFDRCPDCLYDWQFTLKVRRNYFKNLRWP